MDLLKKLKIADCLTLTGLFFSWVGILLILKSEPNWGIVFLMVAFAFDVFDGYVARKLKQTSKFGRELDSFADIFIYLVPSSFLFYFYLSPHDLVGVSIGFFIFALGGLRLVRFNLEGMKKRQGAKYYRGITVVHILFLTLICYFFNELFVFWRGYFSALVLLIASTTMISNYKSYKIENYWLFTLVIFCIIATSLILEYVY